jgi:hypothetical protein
MVDFPDASPAAAVTPRLSRQFGHMPPGALRGNSLPQSGQIGLDIVIWPQSKNNRWLQVSR